MRTIIFIVLATAYGIHAQSSDEVKQAILRAEKYFASDTRQAFVNSMKWLPNSAKIGIGFDSVAGSPVCYTGNCQMEGFRKHVFKLELSKEPKGSCTDLLIPENVELDCLSSTQITANTETISTLKQLTESVKQGIDFSASAGVFGFSLEYSYSHEIRSMVDTILQQKSTVYFTRAIVTWARLNAFIPKLNLSDDFYFVINNMPCCNESAELSEYIRKYIIDYYGLMYVDDLLLGGIEQQKVIVSEENRQNLRQNGFTDKQGAGAQFANAIFSASVKLGVTNSVDRTQLDTFTKFSQQTSITTLGGSTDIQTVEEWSKTIPDNPTIVKFRIQPILDILTARRFPTDRHIDMKRELIRKVQQNYINSPLFCYNNCSNHGTCVGGEYFGVGECKCNGAWKGFDCSRFEPLPRGIIATLNEANSCPSGYQYDVHRLGLYTYPYFSFNSWREAILYRACSSTLDISDSASAGTLCGFVYFGMTILCDGRDPKLQPCPNNYSKYSWTSNGQYPVTLWSCRKISSNTPDVAGTLCGLHSTIDYGIVVQLSCGDYDLSGGSCPNSFTYHQSWIPEVVGGAWLRICSKS